MKSKPKSRRTTPRKRPSFASNPRVSHPFFDTLTQRDWNHIRETARRINAFEGDDRNEIIMTSKGYVEVDWSESSDEPSVIAYGDHIERRFWPVFRKRARRIVRKRVR